MTKKLLIKSKFKNNMPKGVYQHHPFSEATKEKIRQLRIKNPTNPTRYWLEKHFSKDHKNKISKALKGKPKTKEHIKKISESKKGKKRLDMKGNTFGFQKGQIAWNKEKSFSEESKRKMSETHKGEKSNLWQGGKSFEPYTIDWTKTLKRSIRERDKYTCQVCGKEPAIHCHHIDYNKKNCNPDNLIILCKSCHMKTNFNRNYWISYFLTINKK